MAYISIETYERLKDGTFVPFVPQPVDPRRTEHYTDGAVRFVVGDDKPLELGLDYNDIEMTWTAVIIVLRNIYMGGCGEFCETLPEISPELCMRRMDGQLGCTVVRPPSRRQPEAIVLGRVCAEERELVQAILAEARRVDMALHARFPNSPLALDARLAEYDEIAAAMERTLAQARDVEDDAGAQPPDGGAPIR